MELTKEQLDIINSTGNIKINAVAGSGKTTTLIEYAKALTTIITSNHTNLLSLQLNKT